MWYVYILKSNRDGNIYIGSTNNLQRLISEHKNGECVSTAKRRPIELQSYIAVSSNLQARRLEKYFKTGSGTTILKKRILQEL